MIKTTYEGTLILLACGVYIKCHIREGFFGNDLHKLYSSFIQNIEERNNPCY